MLFITRIRILKLQAETGMMSIDKLYFEDGKMIIDGPSYGTVKSLGREQDEEFQVVSYVDCDSFVSGACSSSEESSGSGSNEILLWSSTTGSDGDLIKKNIDQYNDTDPEFKVKLVSMEGGVFNNKLSTVTCSQGRSGYCTDCIGIGIDVPIPEMLEPWNKYIDGTDVKQESYLEEAWNVGNVDGDRSVFRQQWEAG